MHSSSSTDRGNRRVEIFDTVRRLFRLAFHSRDGLVLVNVWAFFARRAWGALKKSVHKVFSRVKSSESLGEDATQSWSRECSTCGGYRNLYSRIIWAKKNLLLTVHKGFTWHSSSELLRKSLGKFQKVQSLMTFLDFWKLLSSNMIETTFFLSRWWLCSLSSHRYCI